MIQLTNLNQMSKAAANAKAAKLHVRRISIFRQYIVENRSKGHTYRVNFFVHGKERFAECTCPARAMCKHIYVAAGLHVMVAAERQQTNH